MGGPRKTRTIRALTLMSRQIGLSKTELYRLVDCPMDGEKLKTLLVERGKVRL